MADKYHSASQQRVLKILLFLGGHEVNGIAPSLIARSLDITPANVTHDLANLEIAGIAERLPDTNRWRLTPRVPQIAIAMLAQIDRSKRKMDELQQRYTRKPY